MRKRVSTQVKSIRRLNYTCPKCGSDMIANDDRLCKKSYSCGKLERDCSGCKDYGSSNRVNLRLKCLACEYEWTILSNM